MRDRCATFEMNKIILFGFIIISLLGCNNLTDANSNNQVLKGQENITSKTKNDNILSQLLIKMEEPELELSDNEIYRFIILDSWGNIKLFKIENYSDHISLTSKRYWQNKNDMVIDHKKLNNTDWVEIKKSLNEINFWNIPFRIDDNQVLHGTAYLIEGYKPSDDTLTSSYHLTSRISPKDTSDYKKIFKRIELLN